MKKISFSLLIIIIVCISLNQWDQFIAEEQNVNAEERAQTKATIHSNEHALQINQTISHLSNEAIYTVFVPDNAENWTCTYHNGDDCGRLWGADEIIKSEGSELHFSYTLPINQESNMVVNDWLIQLSNVTLDHVDLKLIETHHHKGSWFAGIPLTGFVEEELIDYYRFSGSSDNPSLLWHHGEMSPQKTNDNFAIYGNHRSEIKELVQKYDAKLASEDFLTIISTNQLPSGLFGGILILPNSDQMERELVESLYFHSNKQTDNEWFLDLLTSFLISEKPKFALGEHAYNELTEKLTANQLESFVELVAQLDGEISSEKMDKMIAQVTGKQTNFFTELLESNQPISLEMFIMKEYIWNEKERTIKVIEADGVEWVPLQETMSFLEIESERLTETEWAVFKEEDVYRFYSDQSIFIRNEEVYGLLAHPLMKMNGVYYLEKKWLESILHIQLVEENNEVHFTM